ncbi:hypothetical protein [Deinococcus sonorensis]|uniref:Uncharacterized protein n=1 Tax=Deinococcus sonorensis TaxID=309891 RepID=A0ABV8Y8E7_9DEIO
MEFLTYELHSGNTVTFKSDEGGEKSFEIHYDFSGPMPIAFFEHPERWNFTRDGSIPFSHPHIVRGHPFTSEEDLRRLMIMRCRDHGIVVHSDEARGS